MTEQYSKLNSATKEKQERRSVTPKKSVIISAMERVERNRLPHRSFIDVPKSAMFQLEDLETKRKERRGRNFTQKFVAAVTMTLLGKETSEKNETSIKTEEDESPVIKLNSQKKKSLMKKNSKTEYQEKLEEVDRQPLKDQAKIKREANTPAMKQLISMLDDYDEEKRYKKAARHLKDAIYLRPIRHDIDTTSNKFLKLIYFWQSSKTWQDFLYLVSWIFMFLAVFEPPNSLRSNFFDENPTYYVPLVVSETLIVSLYLWEAFMEIYHRAYDDARTFKQKFLKNYKVILKIVLGFVFFLDLVSFHSVYPDEIFRFGRPFRPICLALYQKQLRRTLTGIIQSLNQMLDILVFFFFIIIVYAVIGNRVIGDLGGEVTFDYLQSNFVDFGTTINNMYLLLSRDNYPDVMIPSFRVSPWYLLYFIPYLIINIFLLVPLPIAVMFDSFRTHRGKIVVKDRIKEREALLACFVCMDQDYSLKLELPELANLFNIVYQGRLKSSKIARMFQLMDKEKKDYLNLNDFFELIDIMENNKSLSSPEPRNLRAWVNFRYFLNRKLKLKKIVSNIFFELVMMLVILLNTATILIYFFTSDQSTLDLLDQIDEILIWVYCVEVVLKILGLGILNYFSDGWNVLDFLSTFFSVAFNVVLESNQLGATAKTARALRGIRLQRALKIIRIFRCIKFFRCCKSSFLSWRRVKLLYRNLIHCLPIVFKLALIHFMISYTYAIIGMELLNPDFQVKERTSYMANPYTDFSDIGRALLSLCHIVNQSDWSDFELDFIERFDKLGPVAAYFNTYHVFSNLIIIPLLQGLILEVFTFMSSNLEEQSKFEELLEELEKDERHILFASKTNLNEESQNSINFNTENAQGKLIPAEKMNSEEDDSIELKPRKEKKTVSMNIGLKKKETKQNVVILKKETLQPSKTINHKKTNTSVTKKETLIPKETIDSHLSGAEQSSMDSSPNKKPIAKDNESELALIEDTKYNEFLGLSASKRHAQASEISYLAQIEKNPGDSDSIQSISIDIGEILRKQTTKHHITYVQGIKLVIPRTESILNKTNDEYMLFEEDEGDMDSYLFAEREFFKKKITVLISDSHKHHQLEFAIPTFEGAPKFSNDLIYLKLERKEESMNNLFDLDELDKEKIKDVKEAATLEEYKKLLDKIKKKKKDLGNYNPTVDRIVRKALLRGADIKLIENFESSYLRKQYGSLFDSMRSKVYDYMMPTIETENHCILRLMRLMRQPDLIAKDVVEIIHMIEQSINKNLLKKGSVGKFLFQDSKDRWFCLHNNNGRMKLKYVKYGMWNHYEDLFKDKTKIYHSSDIFYSANSKDPKTEKVVRRLYNTFKQFSILNNDKNLQNLSIHANIWNFYSTCFETENYRGLRVKVSKMAAQLPQISFESLAKLLVVRGIFVTLNYSAATALVDVNSKSSPYYRDPNGMMDANTTLRKHRTILNGVLHVKRERGGSFDEDNNGLDLKKIQKKLTRGGSLEKIDDDNNLQILAAKKQLARKKTRELGQDLGKDITENLFKQNNRVLSVEKASLPDLEYENFLGDLKDIIHWNTDFLLTKINAFYMCHVAKNHKIAND